jgi:hypothetical protein
LQISDIDWLFAIGRDSGGPEVAAQTAELFSVLQGGFTVHDCSTLGCFLGPLISDPSKIDDQASIRVAQFCRSEGIDRFRFQEMCLARLAQIIDSTEGSDQSSASAFSLYLIV